MRGLLKNKKAQDGAVVLALGLALGAHSLIRFRAAAVRTSWILSPWLFPLLISVFALLLAAALFAEGRRELRGGAGEEPAKPAPKRAAAFAAALMSAVYAALLPLLHFLPATAIYLAALTYLFGERRRWAIAAAAILTPLILYALFGLALGVRLP